MESTLRFLMSNQSAFVSGQHVQIGQAAGELVTPTDWSVPLAGKRVLVTGASRGIGLSIAQTMSRDGAQVTMLDVAQVKSDLLLAAEKLDAQHLCLDITAADAASQVLNTAQQQQGFDVVVHNAGITRDKKIANMPQQLWQQVLQVNLVAQEQINDALVDSGGLNTNGRIVCVSSISGIAGNVGQTNYAMSKAGVIGMVESAAPCYFDKGITINAVAPGFIETDMTSTLPFFVRQAGRRMNSLSQGGKPVDVAEAIAWFASPASAGVTGNVLRVCGQNLLGA